MDYYTGHCIFSGKIDDKNKNALDFRMADCGNAAGTTCVGTYAYA